MCNHFFCRKCGKIFYEEKVQDMIKKKKDGILLIISGPSGAGKGTICKEIIKDLGIWQSISMTTRLPREGEVEGVNYYYVT